MKATTYTAPKVHEIPNLPEDADKLEPLFEKRDKALKEHSQILQKQVSLGDNTNSDEKILTVRHNTDIVVDFNPELVRSNKARWVIVEEVLNLFDHTKLAWQNLGDNRVRINIKFDTSPSTAVQVRIRIFGP